MADNKHYLFGEDEEENNRNLEAFNMMLNADASQKEATEHMRTLSTNRQDPIGMRLHMINAHQFNIDNTTWADEGTHDKVPRIQHKLSMMTDRYPKLDDEDITAWHEHEHTTGEFADDFQSEDIGEEHRHL